MWSVNSTGAAPVPPSVPSTTMKFRQDAGFHHGLGNAHEFPGVAKAELETHRFTARQLTQLRDELHHFQGRGERAVA
jgi:hypothetical protein